MFFFNVPRIPNCVSEPVDRFRTGSEPVHYNECRAIVYKNRYTGKPSKTGLGRLDKRLVYLYSRGGSDVRPLRPFSVVSKDRDFFRIVAESDETVDRLMALVYERAADDETYPEIAMDRIPCWDQKDAEDESPVSPLSLGSMYGDPATSSDDPERRTDPHSTDRAWDMMAKILEQSERNTQRIFFDVCVFRMILIRCFVLKTAIQNNE